MHLRTGAFTVAANIVGHLSSLLLQHQCQSLRVLGTDLERNVPSKLISSTSYILSQCLNKSIYILTHFMWVAYIFTAQKLHLCGWSRYILQLNILKTNQYWMTCPKGRELDSTHVDLNQIYDRIHKSLYIVSGHITGLLGYSRI